MKRIEQPFRGGTLVVRINDNGSRDVLFINQWQEVSRPIWDTAIAKAVKQMTTDIVA